jgi:hypothetical protein
LRWVVVEPRKRIHGAGTKPKQKQPWPTAAFLSFSAVGKFFIDSPLSCKISTMNVFLSYRGVVFRQKIPSNFHACGEKHAESDKRYGTKVGLMDIHAA